MNHKYIILLSSTMLSSFSCTPPHCDLFPDMEVNQPENQAEHDNLRDLFPASGNRTQAIEIPKKQTSRVLCVNCSREILTTYHRCK